jgi:integrase
MGGLEASAYLTRLAAERWVATSMHQVAPSAILVLYREVLETDLPWMDEIGRPRTERRLSVVLSTAEVRRLLDAVDQDHDKLGLTAGGGCGTC